MTPRLPQTGPLPHTDEIAQEPITHQPERVKCPICGALVTFSVEYGAHIVDYHHDTRKPDWFNWCGGSGYNLSEVMK